MDWFILISALGTFTVFLPVHVIVLRRIRDRSVIPVFWMTYAVVGAAGHIPLGIMSGVSAMSVSLVLFTLLVGNYFMGIFGVMESSIRMRVLGDVVRAGSRGVSRRTLLAQYNHGNIVDKRLARFVTSGDIMEDDGLYTSRKPFTFFLLPAMVLRFFWWAYGRTNIVYNK
ncbi:hypothetical protein HY339_01090 [Candidatus Gottesmanbacteria bacterium]|nr:hypothetical protein [Candidatus Gottesmanbacteria bacterium]